MFMEKRDMVLALISHYSMGNKAHFADILGIKPQTINSWITRNTFDTELIFANCDGINAEWLLTGRGDMIKSDNPTEHLPVAHRVPEGSVEGIPLIPVEAMAGALTDERSVLEYECERYVVPLFEGADFLIPVKGSSMYPKYSSGDIVACQRVPMSDLFFQWNKVYVISTNQGALIKRIKPGSDKDHILIVSENEKYDPFELPLSAIYGVAVVIGAIHVE